MSLSRIPSKVESRSPTFYITFRYENEEYLILATSIEEFKKKIKEINENPDMELVSHEMKREWIDVYIWY